MTFIYKPSTSKGPVFLHSGGRSDPPTITLPDGTVIKAKYINTIDEGKGANSQYVFPPSVLNKQGAILSFEGKTQTLGNSNMSYRGNEIGSLSESSKGAIGSASGGGYGGGNTFGGGYGGGNALPTFVDASSLQAGQVVAQPVPRPDYSVVDPLAFAQTAGAQNKATYLDNLQTSQQAALNYIGTELQGNAQFAPGASALQQSIASGENTFNRGEIGVANTFNPTQVTPANAFNRSELDASIKASGLPVREIITENLDNARQRAKGFLPTSMEDRAFEMAARSQAGDSLVSRGLGTSTFTQNAIDKYTIGERLALSQQGQADANTWLSAAAKMLIDSPIKYNPLLSSPLGAKASQDISGRPSFSAGAAQQAEQGNLTGLTTMTPGQALSALDAQKQFGANLSNNVNQFNSSQNVAVQGTNVTNDLNVQLQKLANDIRNAGLAYNSAQNIAKTVSGQRQQTQAMNAYQQGIANGTLIQNADGTVTKKDTGSNSIATSGGQF